MDKFFSELRGVILSPWTYRLFRFALAAVFLYAGATKLLETRSFATIIEAYGLAPVTWIRPIAVLLPVLEVLAALGLLFEVRGSLALIVALLFFFMAVLGYGMWMGFDLNCGCCGFDNPEMRKKGGLSVALYRDMGMVATALYLYVWRFRRGSAQAGTRILLKWR